ncbi:NB-ARC domain protein [Sesbania bispinosa]|nr:NB-ARC domain protein [Sesbania bispinosa]
MTSQSIPEVLQTSQRVIPQVTLQSAPGIFQAETIWRLVGLASSVVGLVCYALSPSFNRLIGGWNSVKCFFYGVLFLVVFATILFVKQSSLSTKHGWLRPHVSFAVLMIMSVYSFFYDKAVNGRPEVLSLVSNAAFALVSLSLSKLIKFGFEMGVFSFFLGCLVIQLLTINWKLIFIAIIFSCPLFVMHHSSDSQPEVGNEGQVTNSYSNSQPYHGNRELVIHFSPKSRPEVGSGVQHVIDSGIVGDMNYNEEQALCEVV